MPLVSPRPNRSRHFLVGEVDFFDVDVDLPLIRFGPRSIDARSEQRSVERAQAQEVHFQQADFFGDGAFKLRENVPSPVSYSGTKFSSG